MRNKYSLLPIVAAIALIGSPLARADSAIGVDTVLGNLQSPGGGDPAGHADERGFSMVMEGKGPSHTPSGQLYDYPPAPPDSTDTGNGLAFTGSVEAGYLGGKAEERAAGFREYADWRQGWLVNRFRLGAENADSARYFDLRGGGVGRDDQYYGLEAGRYNGFKLSAFYSETPHVFSTDARPLWNGVGSGNLTLPAGLTAGTHTQADAASYSALQAAVAAAGETSLRVDRKKAGVRLDAPLAEGVNAYASYTNERREGARPFGGAFIFDFIRRSASNPTGSNVFGAVTETVEPIDYISHEFLTGLRFVGDKDRLNLSMSASLFRNNIQSLTWDNPFAIVAGGTIGTNSTSYEQGRFALAPDNEAYNVKAEYARVLPWQGQFTTTVSVGRMLQDDNLLPPTINDGVNASGTPTTYAATIAGYNTTDVLSQKTGGQRIDTKLADVGASVKPTQDLTLRAKLRYYDEENKAHYVAIDPATGKIGYPALDYGLPGVFGAAFGFYNGTNNLHYMSIPTSYSKWTGGAGAAYQLSRLTLVGINYERERVDRPYREVARTTEDRVKLNANTRAVDDGTLRVSYEVADRRGSEYHADIYEHFYTSSRSDYTGPIPVHTLAELRKYDVADRRQTVVNARFNYMLRPDMDAMVSMQHKRNDYTESQYGRIGDDDVNTLNLEWNYMAAPGKSVFTYYTLQKSEMQQGNINQGVSGTRSSPNAGGDNMYPLIGAWTAESADTNHVVGAGFAVDFGLARLESRYSYSWSKTRQSYAYADAQAATVGSGTNETQTASVAGNEFSDMKFHVQALESSVVRPLDKRSAVRLFHRWERRTTVDWHYTGLDSNLLIGQKLYLGATPQDYNVNVVGVFYQLQL
jgi:MtrB/PioB family decaheme-associated outer membrane protein